MSAGKSSQCLLCVFRLSQRLPGPRLRRRIHSTPVYRADSERPVKDDEEIVSQVEIGKQGRKSQKIQPAEWKKQYDPRQMEAIEAAQELIGDRFEKGKNVPRTDPWSVNYYDSYENIDPSADLPVRAPWKNLDDDIQYRTTEDALKEVLEFERDNSEVNEKGGEPYSIKLMKKFDSMRATTGKEEAELKPRSALMPTLMRPKKIPIKKADKKDVLATGEKGKGSYAFKEVAPELIRLMQMTGLDFKTISDLRVKTVATDRVANQTRLGKIYKMKFISVAGNGNGLLGIGEGKSEEPNDARLQSQYRAIRNMQPIKRYEKRTIYGTVNAKVSATELELYARPPGMSFNL